MNYSKLVTNTLYSNPKNFGGKRSLDKIKYLVVHYTGNDGDTAINNLKYSANNITKVSAHFFVDDTDVGLSVPLDTVAWHCGGAKYSDIAKTGGAKFHGICTNSNSIGVELCDRLKDGILMVTPKTYDRAVKLISSLMDDFGIGINNVIRHFDVTGKYCPRYWSKPYGNEAGWENFKKDILKEKGQKTEEPVKPPVVTGDIKVGSKVKLKAGAVQYNGKQINNNYKNKEYIISSIVKDRVILTINKVIIYAVNINSLIVEQKVEKPPTFKEYRVKINTKELKYRSGPGTRYKVNGSVKLGGVYTIIDRKDGWGKLKSGAGWISLKYTKEV